MGNLSTKKRKLADEKRRKEKAQARLAAAMRDLRRIDLDDEDEDLVHVRAMRRRGELLQKKLTEEINDLHYQLNQPDEEDSHESTDFCGRSADRNCSDGGEPV